MLKKIILITLLSLPFSSYSKELIVGVENIDYLPYYGIEHGNYSGFMRDLLDAFAKEYKHTTKYEILPVKRLFNDMVSKKLDIKLPDHPNWSSDLKKDANLLYSQPVVNATEAVLVKKENEKKSADQIKTIGTVAGFTAFALLDLINTKKISIVELPNLHGLIQHLLQNRVDAIYVEKLVALNVLTKMNKKSDDIAMYDKLPFDAHPFMASFQKKHDDVLKEFNIFLSSSNAKKLYKKWNVSVD